MNTSLSLASIRLLAPAALTTPPHFMPEYINNLSLLLGPFFIFTIHRTQSLNLFTDFSFSLSLSLFPFHNRCNFCFPHSEECAAFCSEEIPWPCTLFPFPFPWLHCHFQSLWPWLNFPSQNDLCWEQLDTPTPTSSYQNVLFSLWKVLGPGMILQRFYPPNAQVSVSCTYT